MHLTRAIIKNYRCLINTDVSFNERVNVIVGGNECGKSTLLEAIHLALTGQLNSRPIQIELHPYLFNLEIVASYIDSLRKAITVQPPTISIELFLADEPALARLKGTNNSLGADVPGVVLKIELNPVHATDFAQYIARPDDIRTLPIEFYCVKWRAFADNDITNARMIPLHASFIDASTLKNNVAASRYVIDIVKESLSATERVDLALTYRLMKDRFSAEPKVKTINDALALKAGRISNKVISVSLDTSARATWEAGIMPHLDEIPLPLVGKGEQSSVKIKLALETSASANIVLIEEAENHLSYASLNELISHISANAGARQIFITTHSSFVLNKLGIESVLLFQLGENIRISSLKESTQDYFMKLPGHDTLRLILAKRTILVEGPSDELIVQRAYKDKHGVMPLEDGVDVIAVNSLAFKRFLDIAIALKKETDVITDNDGSLSKLTAKYIGYDTFSFVNLQYDQDETLPTLEPQLLHKNGLVKVNQILGKAFTDDASAITYMTGRKAETALKFFTTDVQWSPPDYVARAIR